MEDFILTVDEVDLLECKLKRLPPEEREESIQTALKLCAFFRHKFADLPHGTVATHWKASKMESSIRDIQP